MMVFAYTNTVRYQWAMGNGQWDVRQKKSKRNLFKMIKVRHRVGRSAQGSGYNSNSKYTVPRFLVLESARFLQLYRQYTGTTT
jgi:hypothetical protein